MVHQEVGFDIDENELEGNGSTYYKTAPSSLTFRSAASLNEFNEVQINGEVVDPSNYILTEGSTIVTLNTNYLDSLSAGNYELTIVSESKAARGVFSVIEPILSEYGFFYDCPYAFINEDGSNVIILHEDGTAGLEVLEGGFDPIIGATFTCSNNILNVIYPENYGGDIISLEIGNDPTELVWSDAGVVFKLDINLVACDKDYTYAYDSVLDHYYVSYPNNRFKSSYDEILSEINNKSVSSLSTGLFRDNTNLIQIPRIPNNITVISDSAFRGCTSLTSVIIPDGIITIDGWAFENCINLTNIILPNTVTTIEAKAFGGCTSLTDINFKGTIEQWNSIYKGTNWCAGTPLLTHILCTDGTIELEMYDK